MGRVGPLQGVRRHPRAIMAESKPYSLPRNRVTLTSEALRRVGLTPHTSPDLAGDVRGDVEPF